MEAYPKLRWRCRRGCKELDLLLLHYLENDYPVADASERRQFAEFLQMDDQPLSELLQNLSRSNKPLGYLLKRY